MEKINKKEWGKSIASFMLVLLMMPLGHALMIVMEHTMSPTTLHFAAFAMGAAGLATVVAGVFVSGDTRQTLFGLTGGMLFWTGWVEFLFMYYAGRFGTQPIVDPATGEIVTRPEYLIMPASFGFWMMVMTLYLFCSSTGCNFINWLQRHLLGSKRPRRVAGSMTRHVAIVTFMELVMIMWVSYLLLMFCYDDVFLGDRHPVTIAIGAACLAGAGMIFARQLRLPSWGANIRMAIATVIVFWMPVEILGRIGLLKEIWIEPMEYIAEMTIILITFILLYAFLWSGARNVRSAVRSSRNDASRTNSH